MLRSWKLGRFAGIDLYLHPTFLLLLLFVYAYDGGALAASLVLAVFGCVVLHEYGHALTARLYGVQTRDITLYPIGGVARLEHMPRSPGAELLITIAGPLVNVAIAALMALVLVLTGGFGSVPGYGLLRLFAMQLLGVNILLAVFNMVPAFPMDGGRILRALLTRPLGRLRATETAVAIGKIMAFLIPVVLTYAVGFNPLHWILAIFVFLAGTAELRQVQAEERSRLPSVTILPDDPNIRVAPPGYCWVSRGPNDWRLAPIIVTVSPSNSPSPGAPTPWSH